VKWVEVREQIPLPEKPPLVEELNVEVYEVPEGGQPTVQLHPSLVVSARLTEERAMKSK
jgi:hypothetical protein